MGKMLPCFYKILLVCWLYCLQDCTCRARETRGYGEIPYNELSDEPQGSGDIDLKEAGDSGCGNHGCSQVCEVIGGIPTCQCMSGYILEENGKTCADLDECALEICGEQARCVNSVGSFSCTCRQGYLMEHDGVCYGMYAPSSDST
ncbi:EGF-like and EMI domain-containing protein 1 [Lingula anatina]|uniref:EGF-like and EMI domain-containing protein 1 n=1 Tax=Lingula anatina TaxID=7574 RepID=A0A1S3KBH0_LINAN|nr:EGF-like and EMI domain-containing protein 1 [Lingula anatina]|eukprot:XP_013419789.1 EGF-like and EMI domain-containing protein 1 [Lingula anatina]